MKKFALFAMLICASFMSFGCEKPKPTTKDKPAATAPDTGGDKAPADTPAEPAK